MSGAVAVAVAVSVSVDVAGSRRANRRRFALALTAIAIAALAVRIGFALALLHPDDFSGDPVYYHEQANLLADGRGFIEPIKLERLQVALPTAYHPPLYPVILAAGSVVGLDSWRAHQLITCLLGTATVVLIGVLARHLAGVRAGLVAAGLAALYPFLWLNDGLVMSETVAALGVAALLVLAYLVIERRQWRWVVALGVATGLATLARGEMALLIPLLAMRAALVGIRGDVRRGLARAGVVALSALAVLSPWVLRNAATFEGRVLVSSNDGTTFFLANCPSTYDRASFHFGSWDFACPSHPRPLDEGLASQQMVEEGLRYARDHVDELPGVLAARLGRTFGFFRPVEQIRKDSWELRSPVWSWVGSAAYYLAIPLALVGARSLRRSGRPIWPLVVPFVVVTVTTLLFYGTTRFRILAEVPLVVLAAVGVTDLVARRDRRRVQPATATGELEVAGSSGAGGR